jgi:chromosomal replication initiation ATPase DnaA
MGCDYYICKKLQINFQNSLSLEIQLEREKGYFNFDEDEDDPDDEVKYNNYVKKLLNSNMKPIIIYEKNQFVNSKLENKYKLLIHEKLILYNNELEWKDILNIKKIEIKYERE